MNNRFEKFITLINVLNKSIYQIKINTVKKYNLTSSCVFIIYYIGRCKTGIKQNDLVNSSLEDKAVVSRVLSRLKKLNLLKETSNNGKRGYNSLIMLNENGNKIFNDIEEQIENVFKESFLDKDDENREIFYNLLSDVVLHVKNYAGNIDK